ncbi:uncharacterized protein LOC111701950 isoform X2 [Eurytemora carolleeae]|uniref:uncharacterized protein LOC111701950 isoform X2 n=1 Tax=Eurytemora carolleeae TaxID=1294199 RepID=UPI000C766BCB|nr:uncharacterized protein LOC111701950 isoform X2 [Eurytemora carolleeae]|eukprot:XP_023329203.1 uncharacterized protein LOC111701950 isoform X2 [Eurytemora affinis]
MNTEQDSHSQKTSPTSLKENGTHSKGTDEKNKIQNRWLRATRLLRRGTRTFLFGKSVDKEQEDLDRSTNSQEIHRDTDIPESSEPETKSKSVWKEHIWSTFIHRAYSEEFSEQTEKGSDQITEFQRAKFRHFFYHVLDLNSDHVISQEDFDRLNERVRHYMDWSSNSIHFLALREVHCLFLDHFLNTSTKISDQSFDFCDPFRNLGSGTEQNTTKVCVSIDEWVDVWGITVGKARKLADLPMWLQYYPKTLFDTINRSGTGEISKKELKLFFTAFMDAGRLGDLSLSRETDKAFNALTSGGDVPLTFHVYKLSFLNFLIGKQPNGPGQFLFGTVEVKDQSSVFPIDYSALNSTQEEREPYSLDKLENRGNRASVIV